jgi:hypothetical protein
MQAAALKAVEVSAPLAKEKPSPDDFTYSTQRFPNCCSATIVYGFSIRYTEEAVKYAYYGSGPKPQAKDWSLPLPEEFYKGVAAKFDGLTDNGGYTEPDTLVCITVPDTEEYRSRGTGNKMYALVEHILENTGWIRGAVGMGQHKWPVQAWTRPSRGKQLQLT